MSQRWMSDDPIRDSSRRSSKKSRVDGARVYAGRIMKDHLCPATRESVIAREIRSSKVGCLRIRRSRPPRNSGILSPAASLERAAICYPTELSGPPSTLTRAFFFSSSSSSSPFFIFPSSFTSMFFSSFLPSPNFCRVCV